MLPKRGDERGDRECVLTARRGLVDDGVYHVFGCRGGNVGSGFVRDAMGVRTEALIQTGDSDCRDGVEG